MATTHPFVMTVPWSQHVFIGDFAAAASVSELNKRKITRLLSVGEAPVFSYEHIMSLQLPFAGISPLKNGEPRKIKQLPPLQQAQLPHAEISYLNACCSFITGQPSQAPLLKRPRTLVYSETYLFLFICALKYFFCSGLKHPVMIAVGYLLLCKNAPLADVAKVFGPLCIHADCCLVPVDLHQVIPYIFVYFTHFSFLFFSYSYWNNAFHKVVKTLSNFQSFVKSFKAHHALQRRNYLQ